MRRHFAVKKAAPPEPEPTETPRNRRAKKQRLRLDDAPKSEPSKPDSSKSDPTKDPRKPIKPNKADQAQDGSGESAPAAAATSSFLSKIREKKGLAPAPTPAQPKTNPYVASPIVPRQFDFKEPNHYVKLGERQRLVDSLSPDEKGYIVDSFPADEWWDQDVEVTALVYEPEEVTAAGTDTPGEQPHETTIYLTKDEQKRKRRNERELAAQEARNRVRQGIDPPPPPKLKRSNVYAVMGAEYLKDPTKYDQMALAAETKRRDDHFAANDARKKTSDEKWAAEQEKIRAHREQGIHCAAFRINSLNDSKHKFLVDVTAKKLALTGVCLSGSFTLVVIEGGEQEVRKFSKLVLKRVNWASSCDGADLSGNKCELVWQGQLKEPRFKKWSIHRMEDTEALKFLGLHGCDAFWQSGS